MEFYKFVFQAKSWNFDLGHKKSWKMKLNVLEHGSVYFYEREENRNWTLFKNRLIDFHEIIFMGKYISKYPKYCKFHSRGLGITKKMWSKLDDGKLLKVMEK